jgi:hypothetical protein
MKFNFSHKWPYFHTLSIFHTNVEWKSNFHINGHIFTHWACFTQISIESHFFTKIIIFSHIEHILHNHFVTFHCGLDFLKFLTFSWWSLHKYRASLADSILGLIIEVMKGGISSNRSNSSSSTAFLISTIHYFPGITNLSLLLVVSETWNTWATCFANTKGSDLYPWWLMSILMNPYLSCRAPLNASTQLQRKREILKLWTSSSQISCI